MYKKNYFTWRYVWILISFPQRFCVFQFVISFRFSDRTFVYISFLIHTSFISDPSVYPNLIRIFGDDKMRERKEEGRIIIIMIIIIIFINCNWVVTRWQWLLYMYTNMKKKVTRKFKSGGLHEKHVVGTWKRKPSQHSLVDTGKPRKTCVEMTGRRTFRILTSSQQSGI